MTNARLEPGTPAPDFTLLGQDGSAVSLADLRGTKTILYFYPAAMTPGGLATNSVAVGANGSAPPM